MTDDYRRRTMTDDATINRRLAEWCGKHRYWCERCDAEFDDIPHGRHTARGILSDCGPVLAPGYPRYTESLDALFAPDGPVERLRERRYEVVMWGCGDAEILNPVPWKEAVLAHTEAATPAQAVARACYAVIEEITTDASAGG